MKARNAANVLKSFSAAHMRNAANTLKTITSIKMRNAAGVLKTAYSSAPPAGNSVNVTPVTHVSFSATSHLNVVDFTANTSGASVNGYVWTLEGVSGGTASIISGQGTAVARVKLTASGSGAASVTVRCAVDFATGADQDDTSLMQHTYTGP